MNIDHLRTYFQHDIGPVLNWSQLESQLEMPKKTLRFWAKSSQRGLPEVFHEKVHAWAKNHGYQEAKQYDPVIFFLIL